MSHPAEGTEGVSKADALKEKLAGIKGAGGNGQSAPAVPANGSGAKAAPAPAKKRSAEKTPAKTPVKAEAKSPAKKEPARKAAKAPAKEPAPRKAAKAQTGLRTMDRDKEGDGLRPLERDIMKVVKAKRGKPISIRDIAIAIHGEAKVKSADEGETKDNVLVRTVRNGIRKPREYGMLKLWTETGDSSAKNGFVVLGDGTPPAGAAKKASKAAKDKAANKTPKTPAKKAESKGGKKPAKKS